MEHTKQAGYMNARKIWGLVSLFFLFSCTEKTSVPAQDTGMLDGVAQVEAGSWLDSNLHESGIADHGPGDGPDQWEAGTGDLTPVDSAGTSLDFTPEQGLVDGPSSAGDGPKPDGPYTSGDLLVPDLTSSLTDGSKKVEQGSAVDLIAPLDGPMAVDMATVVDGPKDSGVDAPADASVDAPADAAMLSDKGLIPPDVTQAGEGGKYLCLAGPAMVEVCRCNDGADNDADKHIDYPADPGCAAPWDHSEVDGTTQCSDNKDNDGDKLIDMADPGCTGWLDNDESSYGTGIPGDNKDPCNQDCFFDGNSGSGDDKCGWNLKCDKLNPGSYIWVKPPKCHYDPTYKKCPTTQPAQCLKVCLPLTPNGCDCFGCCTLAHNGYSATVLLRPSCTPQALTDKTKCVRCTQVKACLNPCGPCEVCIGKPKPEPWCFPKKDSGVPPPPEAGIPPKDSGVAGDTGTSLADKGTIKDSATPSDGAAPKDGNPTASDGPKDVGGSSSDIYSTKPDGGIPAPCPPGVLYCGPGGIDPLQCPSGTVCLTGCCVPRTTVP